MIIPKPRNSHGMCQVGDIAYVYGGANEEGPLNDSFSLNLKTGKFQRLAIKEQ